MKNVPIITFLQRAWMLLAFTLLTNYLTIWKHIFFWVDSGARDEWGNVVWRGLTLFDICGAILLVPGLASALLFVTLLLIHLRYRQTIDADVHNGTYVTDWRAMTSAERVRINNFVFIGILIALCILCASLAKGDTQRVDERARWNSAIINPKCSMALDILVRRFERTQARYQAIQSMKAHGVPAIFLFCLHYRESDNAFDRHAHEGSRLTSRTRDEPKGRPPPPAQPPFTFEQSAFDAYYVCERPTLDKINWTDLQAALDKTESFNGYGYRTRGVAAPYNWSGTNLYNGGKFIADHRFSRTALDGQMGCAAILKRMQERGILLGWH